MVNLLGDNKDNMKTIIAGSRSFNDYELLFAILDNLDWNITEIVSGGCYGADLLGERWATSQNIPIKRFIPDWNKHSRAAGPIRNKQMAEYAEALVAFWNIESKGTKNMIETARKLGLKIKIVKI